MTFRIERIIIIILGGYTVYDSMFGRFVPLERELYLSVILATGVVIAASFFNSRIRYSAVISSMVVLGIGILWLMPLLNRDDLDFVYIIGDFIVVLYPVIFYLASYIYKDLYRDRYNLWLLGIFLVIAMLLAPVIFHLHPLGDRFTPPHFAMIALSWIWFLESIKTRRHRVASTMLSLVILAIAVASTQRTTVVLWLVGLGVMFWLWLKIRQIILLVLVSFAAFMLIIRFIGVGDIKRMMAVKVIEESRFSSLAEGRDQSMLDRFREVMDVRDNINNKWNFLNYILGTGHGATFKPHYSFPERNVKNGRVHNIHIGPAMITFRYGALGFIMWLLLWISALRGLWRMKLQYAAGKIDFAAFTITTTVFFLLLDLLLRNNLTDPLTSFFIAGYIRLRSGHYISQLSELRYLKAMRCSLPKLENKQICTPSP